MRVTLLDIARITGSVCVGMPPELALSRPTGAAIDSRAVKPGCLFFCLPGERADGHDFAAAAVANGAMAVIGTHDPFAPQKAPVPVFIVGDAGKALALLAKAHRADTDALVIGVTGTSGKTSVKEVLAAVLGEHGRTEKNPVNLNNQIGLPLSMLNASPDASHWVMEAGISRSGDMDELGDILRPDVALILNAGNGHEEGLGDRGVAHYKARLLAHLAGRGHAVVSADYPDLRREASSYGVPTLYFSAENGSEAYFAAYLGPSSRPEGGGRFSLFMDGPEVTVTAPFHGGYGAENVAAIGAVASLLGLTDDEIRAGFAKAAPADQRSCVRETGAFLSCDCSYNANPLSMGRMLDAARDMADARGQGLVLVLGEMLELGGNSGEYHFDLGLHAADLAPGAVFWKGGHAAEVEKGLMKGGYSGPFIPVADADAFAAAFRAVLQAGSVTSGVVLFMGSRSNKLEDFVAAFARLAGGGNG